MTTQPMYQCTCKRMINVDYILASQKPGKRKPFGEGISVVTWHCQCTRRFDFMYGEPSFEIPPE